VIENDQYLWAVARYIERNPIKAGLAESAETYAWSSAKAHLTGTEDTLLSEPSWLLPQEQSSYADFVSKDDEATDNSIRRATRTGRPFGSESFVDMLEFRLNLSLKPGKPGRPTSKTGGCP
jgi:putative transposase